MGRKGLGGRSTTSSRACASDNKRCAHTSAYKIDFFEEDTADFLTVARPRLERTIRKEPRRSRI